MVHYECCYSSGRQFVFMEQPRLVFVGLLAFSLLGLLLGTLSAIAVIFADILVFEVAIMLSVVFWIALTWTWAYHDNPRGTAVAIVLVCMTGAIMVAIVRWTCMLQLCTANRFLLMGVGGALLFPLGYGYAQLCCKDDERKHFLGLCDADGETLCPTGSRKGAEVPATAAAQFDTLARYVVWVLSGNAWLDTTNSSRRRSISSSSHDRSISSDSIASPTTYSAMQVSKDGRTFDIPAAVAVFKPSHTQESISLKNRTLKLVKVVLYAQEDFFSALPFGGVCGPCVALVRAEEEISLFPPKTRCGHDVSGYKLKVFQPSLFDVELASCAFVRRGERYALLDVEGSVKRSRLLSAPGVDVRTPTSREESSGDEASGPFCSLVQQHTLSDPQASDDMPSLFAKKSSSGGGLMKRSSSASDLRGELCLHPAPPTQDCHGEGLSDDHADQQQCRLVRVSPSSQAQARRAGPDEVVVRNRSNQDIRALMYRSDDYCYMVPALGKLTGCGDCILAWTERRIDLSSCSNRDFTLKVYSVGAGARELTYFTVSRGNTYTFCDSLLS